MFSSVLQKVGDIVHIVYGARESGHSVNSPVRDAIIQLHIISILNNNNTHNVIIKSIVKIKKKQLLIISISCKCV